MYLFLLVIAIVICALLVLMVLIQNPKGGGLSSNFSSSSQLMGVQKTGDFLEKGTWVLAISLMVLCLAINVAVKGGTDKSENPHKELIEHASKATGGPAASPISIPAAQQQQPATTPQPAQSQPATPAKK